MIKTTDICFLSSMHAPLDKRVFLKEAAALAKLYSVVHIAPGEQKEYSLAGVVVKEYQKPQTLYERFKNLRVLYQLAVEENAHAYHCNELDSWLVGLLLKVTRKKKCIVDIHEHYPEEIAETRFPKWSRPLIKLLTRLFLRVASSATDLTILAKASLVNDFRHLKSNKIATIQNFALQAEEIEYPTMVPHDLNEDMTIGHLGLINDARGLQEMLSALALVKAEKIKLQIIGEVNDRSESDLRSLIESYRLEEHVFYTGWLPHEQAIEKLSDCDVGLIAFQPQYINHIHALPHKLFDYMYVGLPVVAPEFAIDVAQIILDSGCGILVDPSRPESLAAAFRRLKSDSNLRQTMMNNARKAVIERYSWKHEAQKLKDCYARLLEESS